MKAKSKRFLAILLMISMLTTLFSGVTAGASDAEQTLLHLDFSDASQVMADSYGAFYSNRDVFTKHGDGGSATIDLAVHNGHLVIANKMDWARPVIRFGHNFEIGKTYRVEYNIAKVDITKSLSVGALVEITGSLDGNWPTAPAVELPATVVAGDSTKITVEFSFVEEDGTISFRSGEHTTSLPANATIAAVDFALMLGGEGTDCIIDDFKLVEIASIQPEEPEEEVDPDALLHLNFSDASQVKADNYSEFYGNRDVFTKHGNGGDACMDMYVENGKLIIANKTGWARPVIRFNHGFQAGKTYKVEYTIGKTDASKSLSVEHLIQITGSLDGNWPTAPDVMTSAIVIDGDSMTITFEFSFTEKDGVITFHSGDYSASLPANATIAALDFAMVLGGESTGVVIDSFKLFETGTIQPEEPEEEVDPDALLHLNFSDASQVKADNYSEFYGNRDVFTKHGNGGDACMDMYVENGKLIIANKTGWARPVIRFNHGFQAGKTYKVEYTIGKTDASKSLSVEHLIQITGSLDGNWPTAPDVMTSAIVIDGDSMTITFEFSFTEKDGVITFHSGDYSASLPANATIAALDFAMVLGGESTGVVIDSFKLFETGTIQPEEPEEEVDPDALLHLNFSDASQVKADNYSEFYGNRDVFTKHGNGGDACMDMYVENGKLIIANKTGWARPVIRFNHGFQVGKTYKVEYTIGKADTSKSLSVEHLIQITGSLDGNWPTAPDVMTSAIVIDGDSMTITFEFSFTEKDGVITFHSGDYSASLPANATIAALDFAMVLGGESTGVVIDSFKLFETGTIQPEEPEEEVDPDALLHLNFSDASQVKADNYSEFYGNRDVFTKHGNGGDACMDMYVENGKLIIANKTGWARPVIRFNHGFQAGKTYKVEYTIGKTDASKSLSVEHLIQITGSLDGNWPTAPDVMTSAIVIDGDSMTITFEFSFTEKDGVITFHSGDYSASLPANATIAALDFAMVLGGESTGVVIDSFKLFETGTIQPEEPEEEVDPDALLHLNFSDASQVKADNYSEFYGNRDVFTKHGNGGDACMDMYVENGKLIIANKTGWARPVIRFNHGFQVGKTYKVEYTIGKADASKSLSVEHLIQITGSLDGNWPTAPDVMTSAIVIDGDSMTITFEFSFTEKDGVITFHSGDYSASLPANATIAALDFAMVLGGESTGVVIDSFKLFETGTIQPEEPEEEVDPDALLHLNFSDASQVKADNYSEFYGNRDVFTKHGNGGDACMDMYVENGKLIIANKTGWARPVIRFNHGFQAGKTYKVEYTIGKADASKSLSVEHLIQITGSLDGNWPTAPDVMTSAIVIDGDSMTITFEFSFTEENGQIIFHCGDRSVSLPENASLAAFDFALVLGGDADGCWIDDFQLFETGSTGNEPGEGDEEEQKPEVSGIVSNSFHSSAEANNDVNGFMSGSGIWGVNGADGTTTLTVVDSLLKVTGRTGSRTVAVRLGGGDKFPANNTYRMVLRAKNLAPGEQVLGYYIQFIGYKDGSYPVLDFGTDSVALTDQYLMTVSTLFRIEQKDGVITIITANGKKSFDPGVTLAAIDVFVVTGGANDKLDYAIDNFYVDYYNGEIFLDFEDEKDIYNTANSHHSISGVMTPNVGGTSNYDILLAPGEGLDGSVAMHALGATSGWRPEIRLSQGDAKVKIGEPYAVSFWARGADPAHTTKLQLAYGIYYTMPDAPNVYIHVLLYGSMVVVDGQWKQVNSNFIITQTDNGYMVTDGTSYKTIPAGATIAAVDCGLLMLNTTDSKTNYYIDNFALIHLLENPIVMDGIGDDADKIVKNGGMEDPDNIGFGRAWAPAENADILLELVEYEAYAGQFSLKVSNRMLSWHRAQQRLDDLSIFTEGKKFMLSGAVMSEEDTYFSLSIYVTLGFRDEENPSNINYAAMEVPLTTEFIRANIWSFMYGEFGLYINEDGNLVIVNANTEDPTVLEVPENSVGIAAIDVWFTSAAGCELNVLTPYYIDSMEMVQSGTYTEGDVLLGVFEDVDGQQEEEPETDALLYTDAATGIQIYGDPSAIPSGAQFRVEAGANGNAEAALLKKGIRGRLYYTVKLVRGDEEVQPLGKLTIVIPCDADSDEHDKLLLVINDSVVDPAAQMQEDCYSVAVDCLGVFAVAVPSGSDNTGDGGLIIWAPMLMLLAAAAMVIMLKKREGQTA